jgi:4'-phosphopantetheinyl transferase
VSEHWGRADEWTAPESGVLDVWRMELVVRPGDWDLIDAEESERARRIIIDSKRDQKASARAHLRRILAKYTGIEPTALRFSYGEHGKPALVGGGDLRFNLSHSEHIGLLGVSREGLLGVDVEHARPGRAFEDIAERFFSEPEHADLVGLAPDQRAHAFYRAWTRKEAYLKAHGTGLSFASNRFTITYLSGHGEVVSTQMPADDPARWRFHDLDVHPAFAAAACYEGARLRVRLWDAPK